ncbi:DUF2357 domain-containing protein [Dyadobacter sp. MSC1_007]|jgi:predicted component of viral defense system (DUF524 family)|uniref:DUF2357 domain-containing protein n=1 Tax=Dyadobacter sp. MSC1_007 TaxID=2909264 RepID=UPI00202DBAFA|nr:DUF2357 domain-containing protein [Dyadobacter sp. MSC1_007]
MVQSEILIRTETEGIPVDIRIVGEDAGQPAIFEIDEWEAHENGEARIQLLEGQFYEYNVSEDYYLKASEVVAPSRINPSTGRLTPHVYVGTLTMEIMSAVGNRKCAELRIEIRSRKTSYRSDYRLMLEGITEKCTDLLFYYNAPVTHRFIPDHTTDPRTLYQRFAFANAILMSDEFEIAIQRIVTTPITAWREEFIAKDVRNIGKVTRGLVRQMAGGGNRSILSPDHPLKSKLKSLPARMAVGSKSDSVDTAENRFVKHALQVFVAFAGDVKSLAPTGSRLFEEASVLENHLNKFLSHGMFRDISGLASLSLNSNALRQKEGYKQILEVWLMFDLAASLVWRGGDDVYDAGKKDVAVLYEYWLFFQLLYLIKSVFAIEPVGIDQLIKPTRDGLGLQLKQGKHLAVSGLFDGGSRKLNVEFSFNRSFSGKNDYPRAGSWTTGMRPDFTLSLWPAGISQEQAETEELIVHIHFDAKYKVESVAAVFGEDETGVNVNPEASLYQQEDLLKMHSYKDAIRRTAGAYVLYPGDAAKPSKWKGFHELIPGLGAFAIKPAKGNNGTDELKSFLHDVVNHFMNRASQREKVAFRSFDIYNNKPTEEVREVLPEAFGDNRALIPDDTFVLIGFYKNDAHLKWVRKRRLYNFRTGTSGGSLALGSREVNARYLLLHGPGETVSGRLFKIKEPAPRLFSRQDLEKKKYPEPSGAFYLVYKIDLVVEPEFNGQQWDVSRLPGYRANRASGLPFSVSLSELMKVLVK